MKIRKNFVSNSSSTSFIITNHSGQDKTLVDFVKENPQIIEEYRDEYVFCWKNCYVLKSVKYVKKIKKDPLDEYNGYNQTALILSAENRDTKIPPGSREYIFGDEDGDLIGQIFDYMLREGGRSESFSWRYNESLR